MTSHHTSFITLLDSWEKQKQNKNKNRILNTQNFKWTEFLWPKWNYSTWNSDFWNSLNFTQISSTHVQVRKSLQNSSWKHRSNVDFVQWRKACVNFVHFLSSCNQISINFQTPYKMSDLAKFYFLLLLFGNTKLRFDTSDISSIGHLVLTFECWKIFPFSLDYITFHWYWNFL